MVIGLNQKDAKLVSLNFKYGQNLLMPMYIDTTRHHQTCIRRHQTPPDMHQTMSDRLAVVLWWFIELYSWSRFFLPTNGRTNGRTKVFQEVLADLKSCNKISNKNKKNPEKEDEHQREWTMFIEQTIRGRLVETELIVQVLSSGVVIQVVNRETWLFGSLRDQSI